MNKEHKDIIDGVRNKFNKNITEDLLKNIIEFKRSYYEIENRVNQSCIASYLYLLVE